MYTPSRKAHGEGVGYIYIFDPPGGYCNNVGAYLLLGLGCEGNQMQEMIGNMELDRGKHAAWKQPLFLNIQDNHGVASTVEEAARIRGLPMVGTARPVHAKP